MSWLGPQPPEAESKAESREKLELNNVDAVLWVRSAGALIELLVEVWPQGNRKNSVARSSYDLCPKLTPSGSVYILFIPPF